MTIDPTVAIAANPAISHRSLNLSGISALARAAMIVAVPIQRTAET
jgi:hypothetical protein